MLNIIDYYTNIVWHVLVVKIYHNFMRNMSIIIEWVYIILDAWITPYYKYLT